MAAKTYYLEENETFESIRNGAAKPVSLSRALRHKRYVVNHNTQKIELLAPDGRLLKSRNLDPGTPCEWLHGPEDDVRCGEVVHMRDNMPPEVAARELKALEARVARHLNALGLGDTSLLTTAQGTRQLQKAAVERFEQAQNPVAFNLVGSAYKRDLPVPAVFTAWTTPHSDWFISMVAMGVVNRKSMLPVVYHHFPFEDNDVLEPPFPTAEGEQPRQLITITCRIALIYQEHHGANSGFFTELHERFGYYLTWQDLLDCIHNAVPGDFIDPFVSGMAFLFYQDFVDHLGTPMWLGEQTYDSIWSLTAMPSTTVRPNEVKFCASCPELIKTALCHMPYLVMFPQGREALEKTGAERVAQGYYLMVRGKFVILCCDAVEASIAMLTSGHHEEDTVAFLSARGEDVSIRVPISAFRQAIKQLGANLGEYY